MTPLRIAIDDAVLAAEQREGGGEGGRVPLVLIHGFGGTRRDWDGVVAALPPQLPLIAYDQRGFGESRALARSLTRTPTTCLRCSTRWRSPGSTCAACRWAGRPR